MCTRTCVLSTGRGLLKEVEDVFHRSRHRSRRPSRVESTRVSFTTGVGRRVGSLRSVGRLRSSTVSSLVLGPSRPRLGWCKERAGTEDESPTLSPTRSSTDSGSGLRKSDCGRPPDTRSGRRELENHPVPLSRSTPDDDRRGVRRRTYLATHTPTCPDVLTLIYVGTLTHRVPPVSQL